MRLDDIIDGRNGSDDNSQEKAGRYVFFDAVAQQCKDQNALRGQLINVLLAGRDTTACLLTWTL